MKKTEWVPVVRIDKEHNVQSVWFKIMDAFLRAVASVAKSEGIRLVDDVFTGESEVIVYGESDGRHPLLKGDMSSAVKGLSSNIGKTLARLRDHHESGVPYEPTPLDKAVQDFNRVAGTLTSEQCEVRLFPESPAEEIYSPQDPNSITTIRPPTPESQIINKVAVMGVKIIGSEEDLSSPVPCGVILSLSQDKPNIFCTMSVDDAAEVFRRRVSCRIRCEKGRWRVDGELTVV